MKKRDTALEGEEARQQLGLLGEVKAGDWVSDLYPVPDTSSSQIHSQWRQSLPSQDPAGSPVTTLRTTMTLSGTESWGFLSQTTSACTFFPTL